MNSRIKLRAQPGSDERNAGRSNEKAAPNPGAAFTNLTMTRPNSGGEKRDLFSRVQFYSCREDGISPVCNMNSITKKGPSMRRAGLRSRRGSPAPRATTPVDPFRGCWVDSGGRENRHAALRVTRFPEWVPPWLQAVRWPLLPVLFRV